MSSPNLRPDINYPTAPGNASQQPQQPVHQQQGAAPVLPPQQLVQSQSAVVYPPLTNQQQQPSPQSVSTPQYQQPQPVSQPPTFPNGSQGAGFKPSQKAKKHVGINWGITSVIVFLIVIPGVIIIGGGIIGLIMITSMTRGY